jgi:hypothetical protein
MLEASSHEPAFQNLTRSSESAVINTSPEGANAADQTAPAAEGSVATRLVAATSQTRAVPSWLPVTSQRPSGEKAAHVTIQRWPAKIAR